MRTVSHSAGSRELGEESARRSEGSRRAAEALLREHPDAMIFAQSAEGQIVPVPDSLGLGGYPVVTDEARTGVDLCVAEDRMAVVNAWIDLKRDGIAEVRARLRSDPQTWRAVRMLDIRSTHGVILTIGWEVGHPEDGMAEAPAASVSATPRFCTRRQDSEGNVIECDQAYLQMFGHAHEAEVVGHPTFERVHPDDQARLIESWIAMVATARPQMTRARMRRGDGSWLWVDTTYHNYLSAPEGGYVLAECIDVSAEMAAQDALQDREALLRGLIEEMPDGLFQLDTKLELVYHNARLLTILALHGSSREGKAICLEELVAQFGPEQRSALDAALSKALEEGAGGDVELVSERAGEQRYVLFKVRPLRREDALVSGAIVAVQDVTASACARRELERQASTDPLTGADNRAAIIAALRAEIEESGAAGVVYVDLDHFKQVNDTLGHSAGDEVLLETTRRLRRAMRGDDLLGRLGGDEFLVVLRRVAGVAAAMGAAERIGDALRGRYEVGGSSLGLSASVGVAYLDGPRIDAEELIERADGAMYVSKRDRQGVPALARV